MNNRTFIQKKVGNLHFNILNLPNSNFFRFEIVNKFGSNIERLYKDLHNENVYGISHLVEHLSFKSPMDYDTKTLNKLLSSKG
jgi:hypothetical protein